MARSVVLSTTVLFVASVAIATVLTCPWQQLSAWASSNRPGVTGPKAGGGKAPRSSALQVRAEPSGWGGEASLSTLPAYDDEATESPVLFKERTPVKPVSWLKQRQPQRVPLKLFEPKPMVKQSFIADPNFRKKIVKAVKHSDDDPTGRRMIELGCGTGALTGELLRKYPEMVGIELDKRALEVINNAMPSATVIRSDALLVNYTRIAEIRGGPLTIVANLPFHVATQALFTLADHASAIREVYIVHDKSVAKRIVAKKGTREYGIPSVAFQLYSDPRILFDIPPTAFLPRTKAAQIAFLKLDFQAAAERRLELNVDPRDLRNVTTTMFRGRRKLLRNSLDRLLQCHTTKIGRLPLEYEAHSALFLEPWEFVHLTQLIFGEKEFPRHLYRAWRGEHRRTVKK